VGIITLAKSSGSVVVLGTVSVS